MTKNEWTQNMTDSNADLSIIFENEPKQWGLRGDCYMWKELQEECSGKSLPDFADEIVKMVCRKFESVSGVPFTYDAAPFVEKNEHGGMSSGRLSGLFWIGRGMSLLFYDKLLPAYLCLKEQKSKDIGA